MTGQKDVLCMDVLEPKDHGEAVALFRSEIVGVLTRLDLPRGELAARLQLLSQQRFRPPGATATRTFAVPTLERWYRRYKKGGLAALRPEPRADKGAARALTPEQQELICEVRREHASASAELILDTLVLEGRIDRGAISPSAVRRLLSAHGLDRRTLRCGSDGKQRLRWEAERPGALWHGDVCHGAPLVLDHDTKKPVRVHALLDDASRYVLAIEAMHQEREIDMLGLLVRAIRKHGPPDAIYLDNGFDLPRAHPRPGLRADGHDPGARQTVRRAGARQDGAILAHFPPTVPGLHRRPVVAARPQRPALRLPRRALPPLAARGPDGQDARGGVLRSAAPSRRLR